MMGGDVVASLNILIILLFNLCKSLRPYMKRYLQRKHVAEIPKSVAL